MFRPRRVGVGNKPRQLGGTVSPDTRHRVRKLFVTIIFIIVFVANLEGVRLPAEAQGYGPKRENSVIKFNLKRETYYGEERTSGETGRGV